MSKDFLGLYFLVGSGTPPLGASWRDSVVIRLALITSRVLKRMRISHAHSMTNLPYTLYLNQLAYMCDSAVHDLRPPSRRFS